MLENKTYRARPDGLLEDESGNVFDNDGNPVTPTKPLDPGKDEKKGRKE